MIQLKFNKKIGFYCLGSEFESCNFDNDFCGLKTNQYFVRYTGQSPSISGPSSDKTTGII